jgi:hypothetical protein
VNNTWAVVQRALNIAYYSRESKWENVANQLEGLILVAKQVFYLQADDGMDEDTE